MYDAMVFSVIKTHNCYSINRPITRQTEKWTHTHIVITDDFYDFLICILHLISAWGSLWVQFFFIIRTTCRIFVNNHRTLKSLLSCPILFKRYFLDSINYLIPWYNYFKSPELGSWTLIVFLYVLAQMVDLIYTFRFNKSNHSSIR